MTRKPRVLSRALSSARQLLSRKKEKTSPVQMEMRSEKTPTRPSAPHTQPSAPRRVVREADIPLDRIASEYPPTQTSAKSSFRSDGRDHQRDQEFAFGSIDERWNDEDRFTNKSGDPRIGTHRRTYEQGSAHGTNRR